MLSKMLKLTLSAAVACTLVVVLPGMAVQGDVVDVGPHTSDYTGFSRGFSYVAPVSHFITQIELPLDRFAAGDLSSFLIEVNDVVMFYSIGNATAALPTSVLVLSGQEVLIVGNWTTGPAGGFTAKNSYNGTSPYASSILGNPVNLFRAGYQSDIGDGSYTGGAGFTGLTGSHGRIFITVSQVPEPGSLAFLGLGGVAMLFSRRRRVRVT